MRPRNHPYTGAQAVPQVESSILIGDLASQRGTGGVVDHSALEEDIPATWETPDHRLGESTRFRGGPKTCLRRAVGGRRTNGRCGDSGRQARRTNVGSEIGRTEGKPEASPTTAGESEVSIRAMKSGNDWHRTRQSKGKTVPEENSRRDP